MTAAVSIETFENTFTAWLRSVTGYSNDRVIIYNPNGPQPNGSFVYFWLKEYDPLPHDTKQTVDNNDDTCSEVTRGLCFCELVIGVWGPRNHKQIMNRIRSSLQADARIFDIYEVFGRTQVGPVRDITAKFAGRLEHRSEMSIFGYATFHETFDLDVFDRVSVTTGSRSVTVGLNNPPPRRQCNQ